MLARVQVAQAELPVFGRVVNPLLQPLALLVKADVQQELEHHRAGLAEHALEVIDVGKALRRLRRRDPAIDGRHQHVFVMAAVENHHFARAGHLLVNAPEVVMRTLILGGRFPADGARPQRAEALEHAAYGAVLARGVGALQDHQQLVALVRVKQVLQGVELARQGFHGGLVAQFVAGGKRLGRGIEISQCAAPAFVFALCCGGLHLVRLPQRQLFFQRFDGCFAGRGFGWGGGVNAGRGLTAGIAVSGKGYKPG